MRRQRRCRRRRRSRSPAGAACVARRGQGRWSTVQARQAGRRSSMSVGRSGAAWIAVLRVPGDCCQCLWFVGRLAGCCAASAGPARRTSCQACLPTAGSRARKQLSGPRNDRIRSAVTVKGPRRERRRSFGAGMLRPVTVPRSLGLPPLSTHPGRQCAKLVTAVGQPAPAATVTLGHACACRRET